MAAHALLEFARLNSWPAGIRAHVLWNGQVAGNGDGKPADNPADPVDGAAPLTPVALGIWPFGKAGDGAGPDGSGIDGGLRNWHVSMGDGLEVDGLGEDGLYNDYFTWSTDRVFRALRDGSYKFAVRFEDEHGTVQTDALVETAVEIRGVPRPPVELRFVGWDDVSDEIDLAWEHSPDLQ